MAIYLIRRTLYSLGDAICIEPVISLTNEIIGKSGDEIWLQCDGRIADIYRHHPLINKILLPEQEPPKDTRIVLDISNAEQCPSIRALMTGGKFNATQLFCDASVVDGQPLVWDGRPPRLYFSDAEKREINFIRRSIPKKKIAVQIKAGHWWKVYPHLETLLELLFKLDDVQLFITNDEPISLKHHGMISLVQLSYSDLRLWLGAMDLFIGLDSGPTHLSAALGTRTYAIFGPTDPDVIIGMYGNHVSWNKFAALRCPRERCWLRPCKKVICLKTLSPWRIIKDIKPILASDYENPRIRFADVPVRPSEESRGATEQVSRGANERFAHLPKSSAQGDGMALMRLDGLGGTLTLADQAKKLHEMQGEPVTLITRGYEMLFENNPHIKEIINVGMRDWKECSMVFRNSYPDFAEIRFGLGKWFSSNHRNGIKRQDFTDFEGMFNQFPLDFNQLKKYGLHHIQLTDKTLNLPYDTIDTELFLDDERFEIDGDFVLVNNGVDVIHKGMRQTKVWERWDELIPLLPMKVVQAGTLNDPPIEGVIDLRGQTNLKQLVYLIKKARSVVVNEGGIMHTAYAAKQPNVIVLGGPTQGVLFAYPEHTWITSYICGDCWSTREDWYVRCPKDADAICMKTISPHRVVECVLEMI